MDGYTVFPSVKKDLIEKTDFLDSWDQGAKWDAEKKEWVPQKWDESRPSILMPYGETQECYVLVEDGVATGAALLPIATDLEGGEAANFPVIERDEWNQEWQFAHPQDLNRFLTPEKVKELFGRATSGELQVELQGVKEHVDQFKKDAGLEPKSGPFKPAGEEEQEPPNIDEPGLT